MVLWTTGVRLRLDQPREPEDTKRGPMKWNGLRVPEQLIITGIWVNFAQDVDLHVAHGQVHVASAQERIARRGKAPVREIKAMVRAPLEEHGKKSINVLRCPAMDNIQIERYDRGTHEDGGQAADDDELDARIEQIREQLLGGIIERHGSWFPASSR